MITSSYAIRKRQSASETPWWRPDETIDAADILFYGQDVSDSETVASTYTGNFTYAVRANFPGADAVNRDLFISSTDDAKDYLIRARGTDGVIRLITPGFGTSTGALSGDMVVFVVVDESGDEVRIYFNDGTIEETTAALLGNTGEILIGQKWFDSVAFGANATAVHVSSIVLDATQRANLYTAMAAL